MFSKVGRRLPGHATALGKAILARQHDRFDELYPKEVQLESLTPHTITTRESLRRELETVRTRGYAIDRQENVIGVNCFAMPIAGNSTVQDVISVSVPLARLDPSQERRIVRLLKECIGRSEPADGALYVVTI